MKQGKCIIISAPSGAGKTTIVRQLLKLNLGLQFSVSACSREKRQGETHGKDYHFLSVDEFTSRIHKDEFVEWEEVYHNQYYGTLKSEIQRIWETGNTVIFDVDVVGGLNLKQQFGDASLAIFIMPPSFDVMEKRLRSRGTESEKKIQIRLSKARQELEQAANFDKVVVNDNLNQAIGNAEQLVRDFLSV